MTGLVEPDQVLEYQPDQRNVSRSGWCAVAPRTFEAGACDHWHPRFVNGAINPAL
jgi:hypothetical protein